jgi:hypothetical protein
MAPGQRKRDRSVAFIGPTIDVGPEAVIPAFRTRFSRRQIQSET